MYATFQLRGSTDNIASLFASTKVQNVVYADAMIGDILSIGFYPLQGDEAGYAGMSRLDVYKRQAGAFSGWGRCSLLV